MIRNEIALGIDIGGTNTVLGFVDSNGECIIDTSIPTNAHEEAPYLFKRIFEVVDNLYKDYSNEYQIIGIGIGAPNANYYKGTVEQPPNLNWGTVNIIELVNQFSPLPASITNDANAAAIGELEFGAAKGMRDFIVITLGTGLGSGIVSNGHLLYGHDGFAGEIGHTVVEMNGRQCGCGKRGCLETYVSAPGIVRTVFELLADSNEESTLREFTYKDLNSKMICNAANNGDSIALKAFDYTGKILGLKLADSVAHTSPEAIILFGGLANAGDLLFKPAKKYMEEFMFKSFKNKVQLIPSGLTKGNTAVLGAAALIWNELLREKNPEHISK